MPFIHHSNTLRSMLSCCLLQENTNGLPSPTSLPPFSSPLLSSFPLPSLHSSYSLLSSVCIRQQGQTWNSKEKSQLVKEGIPPSLPFSAVRGGRCDSAAADASQLQLTTSRDQEPSAPAAWSYDQISFWQCILGFVVFWIPKTEQVFCKNVEQINDKSLIWPN